MLSSSLGLPRWQGHGAQERMRWRWYEVDGLLGGSRKDPDSILWQSSLLLGLVDLLLSVTHKAATLLGGGCVAGLGGCVVGLGHVVWFEFGDQPVLKANSQDIFLFFCFVLAKPLSLSSPLPDPPLSYLHPWPLPLSTLVGFW